MALGVHALGTRDSTVSKARWPLAAERRGRGGGDRYILRETDGRLHNPERERGTERASHRPKATQLCPSQDLSPGLTPVY